MVVSSNVRVTDYEVLLLKFKSPVTNVEGYILRVTNYKYFD